MITREPARGASPPTGRLLLVLDPRVSDLAGLEKYAPAILPRQELEQRAAALHPAAMRPGRIHRPLLSAKEAAARRPEGRGIVHRPQVQRVTIELVPVELEPGRDVELPRRTRHRPLRLLRVGVEERLAAGRRDERPPV